MKIAVYVSAVPAKTKNDFKRDLLLKFAQGAKAAGDEVWAVEDINSVIDCDIAVIQGWIGMKSGPHLEQRQRVIKHQRKNGKHTLVIDSNLFGFLDPNDFNRYLRYSLDGIFPTTGYYFDSKIDLSQWTEIKNRYNFQERPWTTTGKNILVCLQRDGGWSMDGKSVVDWTREIVSLIQMQTNRPIMIRPHPGNLKILSDLQKALPKQKISTESDLRKDLDQSWCTITYNSSPAVASLVWGVPAFITDPDPRRSQAHGYACTDLSLIENPPKVDRTGLYNRLAQCHFATDSLTTGHAWKFMRDRLP